MGQVPRDDGCDHHEDDHRHVAGFSAGRRTVLLEGPSQTRAKPRPGLSGAGQHRHNASVHRSLVEELPPTVGGAVGHRNGRTGDEHPADDVDEPMDAEIDDGERREQRVDEHGVAVPIPASVVVKPCQAQPNSERNTDVQGRHTVGKRVDSSEPISNFRGERVRQCFHPRDGVARHPDVEEEVERNGQDVHPGDGEGHTVSEPAVVEISEVEHRHIADEHEPRHVKVGQG